VRASVVLAASLRRALVEQSSELTPLAIGLASLVLALVSQAFLGHLVDAGYNAALGAYEGHYATFLLLGMALLDVQFSVIGGLSRSIREAQIYGTFESLLATPTPMPLLLLALALPEIVFALARLLFYAALGVILFGLKIDVVNLFGVTVVLTAAFAGFAALTLFGASLTMILRRADPLTVLISTSSMIAGGVFYPRGIMPHWMAAVGGVLPIAPAVDALRAACVYHAGPMEPSVLRPLLRLGAFVLVAGPLGAWLFSRTLARARQEGSLTSF
jgi:ABC-2 type transport system permease protein